MLRVVRAKHNKAKVLTVLTSFYIYYGKIETDSYKLIRINLSDLVIIHSTTYRPKFPTVLVI